MAADEAGTRAEIDGLLQMSEDELLKRLGADLFGNLAMPADPRDVRERATRFFEGQREAIQSRVCTSQSLKAFAMKKSDNSEIAIEVLKMISTLVLPVSPVVLAVLIARKGLLTFCPAWAD